MISRLAAIYNKFGQGMLVAGYFITSGVTLTCIWNDVNNVERSKLKNEYNSRINQLETDIQLLKNENKRLNKLYMLYDGK
jgi:hypothetical protein